MRREEDKKRKKKIIIFIIIILLILLALKLLYCFVFNKKNIDKSLQHKLGSNTENVNDNRSKELISNETKEKIEQKIEESGIQLENISQEEKKELVTNTINELEKNKQKISNIINKVSKNGKLDKNSNEYKKVKEELSKELKANKEINKITEKINKDKDKENVDKVIDKIIDIAIETIEENKNENSNKDTSEEDKNNDSSSNTAEKPEENDSNNVDNNSGKEENTDEKQEQPEQPNKEEEPKNEKPIEKKPPFTAGKAVMREYEKDGKKIYSLWTKGITPPDISEFTVDIQNDFETYSIPYKKGNGWYDSNKIKYPTESGFNDAVLCSGAVASNMLHWWMDQNRDYINRYIAQDPSNALLEGQYSVWRDLNTYKDSFKAQDSSKLFDMYKLYFGNVVRNLWADTSIDFFINGYRPSETGATNTETRYNKDNRGGFFYKVFGKEILTKRNYSGDVNSFSSLVKYELREGNVLGLEHRTAAKYTTHIINIWGADFDENGTIIGLYISDSDDQFEGNVGMKRYKVINKNGRAAITTSKTPGVGAELDFVHVLRTGSDIWEEYFRNNP